MLRPVEVSQIHPARAEDSGEEHPFRPDPEKRAQADGQPPPRTQGKKIERGKDPRDEERRLHPRKGRPRHPGLQEKEEKPRK